MSRTFAIIGQPTDYVGALPLFKQSAYLVDTILATGTIPDGFIFPEGQIAEAGIAFNSALLVSSALRILLSTMCMPTSPRFPSRHRW